jgi:hypothetical protein
MICLPTSFNIQGPHQISAIESSAYDNKSRIRIQYYYNNKTTLLSEKSINFLYRMLFLLLQGPAIFVSFYNLIF